MDSRSRKSRATGLMAFAVVGVVGLLLQGSAQAGVILNDNFENALINPNDYGWYARTAGGVGWVTATVSLPTDGSFGTRALQHGPGQENLTRLRKQFAPITLANTGDSITLAYDVYVGVPVSTNSNPNKLDVRGALAYSASHQTSDAIGGTDPLADIAGYGTRHDITHNDGSAAATAPHYNTLNSSGTVLPKIGIASTTLTAPGLVPHHYQLAFTRIASGLQIGLVIDSTSFQTYTATSPTTYTFNTIELSGIYSTTGSGGFSPFSRWDNVLVTTTVPEPNSLGLLALSGLAALRRRRCA